MASEPLIHASRKFYDLPQHELTSEQGTPERTDVKHDLLEYVKQNIIGIDKTFKSAFGTRKAIYTDYTASGRSLSFIEDFIRSQVLPEYGNTHTTTTVTSLQTTLFRHEARDIVRNSVNASEHDAVIFVGSGCTGAVHKLINALNLTQLPVVFVGPYEHHSNMLPWRELGSHMVNIQETSDGLINMDHLKHELKVWQGSGRQLIGAFAAASNVTGTVVDVNSVTACLHKHGALALWDYATAAPYVDIDMNPVISGEDRPYVYKDAVFLSTHKFVGGVQTPGVLIAKKKLFKNNVPHDGGGGSVFFVRKDAHRYLQETEMREEGGTPAIVESVRAGLVFQLKEAIGTEIIQARDEQLCRKAFEKFASVKELRLLGSKKAPRLPIFSFLIQHAESGLYLHFNYVAALLNDLFGIQTRGGCACAGPYAQDLLGIGQVLAEDIENVLAEDSRLDRVHLRRYREYSDKEILRPGFTRLNLPYFEDDETINFILEAVKLIAEHGWKMLPHYNFNPETGEWRHRKEQVFKDRKWLGNLSYANGKLVYTQPVSTTSEDCPKTLQECLEIGSKMLTNANFTKLHIGDQSVMFDDVTSRLRWFLLPSEAYTLLQKSSGNATTYTKFKSPFDPPEYPRKLPEDIKNAWTQCTCLTSVDKNSCVVHRPNTKCTEANDQSDSLDLRKRIDKSSSETKEPFKTALESYLQQGFIAENGTSSLKENQINDSRSEIIVQTTSQVESDESSVPSVTDSVDKDILKRNFSAIVNSVENDSEENSQISQSSQETCNNKEENQSENNTEKRGIDSNEPKCETRACPCLQRPEKKPSSEVSSNENGDLKSSIKERTSVKHRDWHIPPKATIFRPMADAIKKYNMLENGDRVMVCLSGGKDSLSLLHSLHQYQFYSAKKGLHFDLGAVTIDPQTASYDPSPLKAYLKMLGVPYFYEEQNIMESAKSLPYDCASICSYCSRMKRGRIYTAARREGYNVLAMGQHLDDIAESFLMSVFHNGLLRTMKAAYVINEGDLRVIRPLIAVREKDLRAFAEEKQLPVISENCPACFEEPKERHRMKQLLASQEVLHPRLFHSINSSLQPLLAINKTGVNANDLLESLNTKKTPKFTKGKRNDVINSEAENSTE